MKKAILFALLAFTANMANAQWQILNGPTATAQALLTTDDYVFAGLTGVSAATGVSRSSDNGTTWVPTNSAELPFDINALAKNDAYIYAAQGTHVFLSSNSGDNWSNVSTGLPLHNVNAFAVSTGALYAGTQNIYKTTDNGLIWNNITVGWNGSVSSLAVQGNIIMAGTLSEGIYISTDNGITWNISIAGLPNQVNAVTIFGSTLLAGTPDGVYVSTDMGASWSASDLIDAINAFTIVESTIFAATSDNGVFMSTTNGTTWENISEGLEVTAVTSLAANDAYLFAGILGSYVCRRPLSEIIVTSTNDIQNSDAVNIYPNPATDKVNITLQNHSGEAVVRIYTTTGQEVAATTYGNKNALSIDVSDLAQGFYFVRIDTYGGSFVKKVVVE